MQLITGKRDCQGLQNIKPITFQLLVHRNLISKQQESNTTTKIVYFQRLHGSRVYNTNVLHVLQRYLGSRVYNYCIYFKGTSAPECTILTYCMYYVCTWCIHSLVHTFVHVPTLYGCKYLAKRFLYHQLIEASSSLGYKSPVVMGTTIAQHMQPSCQCKPKGGA